MKNILFIAFEFPPLNTGGVYRSIRFANRLRKININPIIITANPEEAYQANRIDHSLNNKVASDLTIIRLGFKKGGLWQKFISTGYSFEPDTIFNGWIEEFKKEVPEIIKRFQPEAIFITLPPFSLSKLALWLKKSYNLPLIVDMRDAWSHWVMSPYATYAHYKNIRKREYALLKAADAILVTSPQTIEDFQTLCKDIPKEKYHFIPNSFDEYLNNPSLFSCSKDKVKIGYVGSFYYNPVSHKLITSPWYKKRPYQYLQYLPRVENWLYRSPYFFFRTLSHLFKQYPEYRAKVELIIAGARPDWFDKMAEDFNVSDIIDHKGIINQQASLLLQKECDLLLITSSKVINGSDYSIAGKTFEYFSMRKPILAFVCEGSQKWILQESGISILINPDDIDEGVKKLKTVLDKELSVNPNWSFVDQFRTDNVIEKLSDVFKTILE